MIGVIGVAPVHVAVLTVDNGTHGGNLDIQELTIGNSVMLRVWHDGAHLFLDAIATRSRATARPME
jgi:acetamidase/formamidase